jgi:hypothetical protein
MRQRIARSTIRLSGGVRQGLAIGIEGFHVEAEYGAGGREEGFHDRVTESQRKRKEEEKDLTQKRRRGDAEGVSRNEAKKRGAKP